MGRDPKTLLRKFHEAKWDEQIIFEMSVPGERGILVAEARSERQESGRQRHRGRYPKKLRRRDAPALPEINQMRVLRHFMHLSQETMGTDVTIDISQGTCTMKYSPKVQEHLAGRHPGIREIHPLQPAETDAGVDGDHLQARAVPEGDLRDGPVLVPARRRSPGRLHRRPR